MTAHAAPAGDDDPQLDAILSWLAKNRPRETGLVGILRKFARGQQLAEVFQHLRERHQDQIGASRMDIIVRGLLRLAYVKGPGSLLDEGLNQGLEDLCAMDYLPYHVPSVGSSSSIPRKVSPQTDDAHYRRTYIIEHFLSCALRDGRVSAQQFGQAQQILAARRARRSNIQGRPHGNQRPSVTEIDAVLARIHVVFIGHQLLVMDSLTRQVRSNSSRNAPMLEAKRKHVVWIDGAPAAIYTRPSRRTKPNNASFIAPGDRQAFLDLYHGSPYRDPEDALYYNWVQAEKGGPAQPAHAPSVLKALEKASKGILDPPLHIKDLRPAGHRRMTVAGLSDREIEALLNRAPGSRMIIRYTDVLSALDMVRWMCNIRGLDAHGPRIYHARCRGLLDGGGRCPACDGPGTPPGPATPTQPADLLAEVFRRRQALAGEA